MKEYLPNKGVSKNNSHSYLEQNTTDLMEASKIRKEYFQDESESHLLHITEEKCQLSDLNSINQHKAIDIILDKLGYTQLHLIIIFCAGMSYLAEGDQLYSLNLFMPIFKEIFADTHEHWQTLLASSFFIGYIIGNFLTGWICSIFGRRRSVNFFCVFFSLNSILTCLLENMFYMIFCRIMIGICIGIIAPQCISNLSEFIPTYSKELVILSMYIFFRFGVIYFIVCFKLVMTDLNNSNHNWKFTMLLASLPVVISTVLSLMFFRDSPKLQLSNGELEKTICTLYELANEKPNYIQSRISKEDISKLRVDFMTNSLLNDIKNDYSISIFNSKYRRLILLSSLIFITSSMINIINMYSLPLMLSSVKEKQDKAYEVLITQIVTIPALILTTLACNMIGRKNSMYIGFIFSFISSGFPSLFRYGLVESFVFTNFFIIFALCTIKIYIIEAFPTRLRDYALAFCFSAAKFGDAFVPILCNLSLNLYSYGPMVLINIFCIIGLISTIYLPFDTLGLHIE